MLWCLCSILNLATSTPVSVGLEPFSERTNFINTLQSMVYSDLDFRSGESESRQRRTDPDTNPYLWKFFIKPKDLESFLNSSRDARDLSESRIARTLMNAMPLDINNNNISSKNNNNISNKNNNNIREIRKIHSQDKDGKKKATKGKEEEEERKIGVVDRELLRRYVRSVDSPSPDSPAVLYLPLGGGGVNECEPAGSGC